MIRTATADMPMTRHIAAMDKLPTFAFNHPLWTWGGVRLDRGHEGYRL